MTVNLRTRLWGMITLAMLGIAALVLINALNTCSDLLAEKKLKTRHLVEAAHGVLEYWHARYQSGDAGEASAQRAALGSIRAMRYEGKEYFWINDFTTPIPKIVMHPAAPSLEGKPTDDEKYNRATSMQDGVSSPVVSLDGARNIIPVHSPILLVSVISGWESSGGDLAMSKPVDEPEFLKNVRRLLDGSA